MNKNGLVTPIITGRKKLAKPQDAIGYVLYNKSSGAPISHNLKIYRNGEATGMMIIPVFLTDWEARKYQERDALCKHIACIKSVIIHGDAKYKRPHRKRVESVID